MKLFITIITFLSAMSVSASPLFDALFLHKRQIGGVRLYLSPAILVSTLTSSFKVLICTGANQTGDCTHKVYELEKCHQLPKPYYHNVSTFAPDGESFQCYPRTTGCDDICKSPTGCTFGPVDFNYEHKDNLTAIQWNTLFSSFDCFLKKKKSSSLLA
ncbi:hypothetical protein FHETE_4845 [Fusarium heterosporum]|uniref:Uncharacterized protein n=1 Tax=Fusarium heterosporum TaxID=42747 RepID=A0A8H5WSQ4_FUSHE|nr:hypothetical protein FHETE_4845 [Fusarium heterosporum]